MGYYAVNKITGRVVEGLPPKFNTIQGKSLAKAQTKIRDDHCIDEKLVKKYKSVPPA